MIHAAIRFQREWHCRSKDRREEAGEEEEETGEEKAEKEEEEQHDSVPQMLQRR